MKTLIITLILLTSPTPFQGGGRGVVAIASTVPLTATALPSWASGCQDWVTILANDKAQDKGAKPQEVDSQDYCGLLFDEGYSASTN